MNPLNETDAVVVDEDEEQKDMKTEEQFTEMCSVASVLVQKAESGGLDTGFEVTSLAVAFPADICGLPGGNGATCNDASGEANGDNFTCAESHTAISPPVWWFSRTLRPASQPRGGRSRSRPLA